MNDMEEIKRVNIHTREDEEKIVKKTILIFEKLNHEKF